MCVWGGGGGGGGGGGYKTTVLGSWALGTLRKPKIQKRNKCKRKRYRINGTHLIQMISKIVTYE